MTVSILHFQFNIFVCVTIQNILYMLPTSSDILFIAGDCKTGVFDISVSSYCTDKGRMLEKSDSLNKANIMLICSPWEECVQCTN
jgi:hypothetical protein